MSALPSIITCNIIVCVGKKDFTFSLPLCSQTENFKNFYGTYLRTRDFNMLLKVYEYLYVWLVSAKKKLEAHIYNETNFFKLIHTISIEALKHEELQPELNAFKIFSIVNKVTSIFSNYDENEFIQKQNPMWLKKHTKSGLKMEDRLKKDDFKQSDFVEAGLVIRELNKEQQQFAIEATPFEFNVISGVVSQETFEEIKKEEEDASVLKNKRIENFKQSVDLVLQLIKLFVPLEEKDNITGWFSYCADHIATKPLVLCGPRSKIKTILIHSIKKMFTNIEFIWTEDRKEIENEPTEILFGNYEQLITDLGKPIIELTDQFADPITGHVRTVTVERCFNMIIDLGADFTSSDKALVVHVKEVDECQVGNPEQLCKLINTLTRIIDNFEKEKKDGSTTEKAIDLVD